jgi:hypothetical protein
MTPPSFDDAPIGSGCLGETFAEHVAAALEGAPPLTGSQRDRIAALLQAGAA